MAQFDVISTVPLSGYQPEGALGLDATNAQLYVSGSSLMWEPVGGGAGSAQGGPTSARPASPVQYQSYFDTTLGLPIWYTGSTWVNAAGVVS
jgi:hypothetical protein